MKPLELPGIEAPRFHMQAWNNTEVCTCGKHPNHEPGCKYPTGHNEWQGMEHGAARQRWAPKTNARDAVRQACRWAGAVHGVGIPVMQVVEMPSGTVIWRDGHFGFYPDAGGPVTPDWQAEVYAQAVAEYEADVQAAGERNQPDHAGESTEDSGHIQEAFF